MLSTRPELICIDTGYSRARLLAAQEPGSWFGLAARARLAPRPAEAWAQLERAARRDPYLLTAIGSALRQLARARRSWPEPLGLACEGGLRAAVLGGRLRLLSLQETDWGELGLSRPHGVGKPAAPPPRPERPAELQPYAVRLVDELGVPVAGALLGLRLEGEPAERRAATDGDGWVRTEPVAARHAFARVIDHPALGELLRPRWDAAPRQPWLEPEPDHSFHALHTGRPIEHALLGELPHTLVVQPWVVRARLLGMYFDTNKCFLLPSAVDSMKQLVALYAELEPAALLVVGHTDTTGEPDYNDPLSLERAEATAAYLTDDVGAWLRWYGMDKPPEKRWGSHEDHLMISKLLDWPTPPPDESPVRWFQRTRGLTLDGIAGPQTRGALVAEYMALDGTTLPAGSPLTAHGCGESFPLPDDDLARLTADLDPDDEARKQAHRRVELYFFDRAMGIQPPPPGDISPPGSLEYPEWVARARETRDFELGRGRRAPLWIRLALLPVEAAGSSDVFRVRSASGLVDVTAAVATSHVPDERSVDLPVGDVPTDDRFTVEVSDGSSPSPQPVVRDAPYDSLHDDRRVADAPSDGQPAEARSSWSRSGKPVPGPPRAGASIHLRRRIQSATIVVVEFLDDLAELTPRNHPGWDYAAGGTRYTDIDRPAYRAGRGRSQVDGDQVPAIHPVHLERGITPELYVELQLQPADAAPEIGTLVATPRPGASGQKWWPTARSRPALLDPSEGTNTLLPFGAAAPLPNGPAIIDGLVLDWTLELDDRIVPCGSTGPHTIYIIYGPPWARRDADAPWPPPAPSVKEYGVTEKRTRAAVQFVHGALLAKWGTFEDVGTKPLLEALHHAHPRYRFTPSPAMSGPYVQATRAVGYLHNVVGGAWPHIDFPGTGAECQALVRLVDGVLRQLGTEGKYLRGYVYADPRVNGGLSALFQPFADEPGSPPMPPMFRFAEVTYPDKHGRAHTKFLLSYCSLVTLPNARKGDVYDRNALGINRYEAVLRVETSGVIVYYAGGGGVFSGSDDDELINQVLRTSFEALIYWAKHPENPEMAVVTDVVAYY